MIACSEQKDVNIKNELTAEVGEEPDLQLGRGDRTGKRNWVADAWRNCDEEDSHGDIYLVIYRQVPLWGNKTLGRDIGDDSRGRVNRLGVVKREWEREICGRV
jgi:hypothetical protein